MPENAAKWPYARKPRGRSRRGRTGRDVLFFGPRGCRFPRVDENRVERQARQRARRRRRHASTSDRRRTPCHPGRGPTPVRHDKRRVPSEAEGICRARLSGKAAAARGSGEGRNRTGDTTVFSRVLYRLSYLADVSRRSSRRRDRLAFRAMACRADGTPRRDHRRRARPGAGPPRGRHGAVGDPLRGARRADRRARPPRSRTWGTSSRRWRRRSEPATSAPGSSTRSRRRVRGSRAQVAQAREEQLPLVLGGDHSVALGTLGGLARARGPAGCSGSTRTAT